MVTRFSLCRIGLFLPLITSLTFLVACETTRGVFAGNTWCETGQRTGHDVVYTGDGAATARLCWDRDVAECRLRDAIRSANLCTVEQTLHLAVAATYSVEYSDPRSTGDWLYTGLPTIERTLTILGNGATIERRSLDGFRLLHVANTGVLTLRNLTVSNGNQFDAGGAILNEGQLSLDTVSLTNNRGAIGGAVMNVGTLTAQAVQFRLNQADEQGGALYTEGHARISNSLVDGNRAQSGGGIYLDGGQTEIYQSAISNNRAEESGGALEYSGALTSRVPLVSIVSSTIAANAAVFGGAAYFQGSGLIRLTDVTIAANTILTPSWASPDVLRAAGINARFTGSGLSISVENTIVSNAGPGADCLFTPSGGFSRATGLDSDSTCSGLTTGSASLGPLQLNGGGTTPTMVPAPYSDAIDSGSSCQPTDQNGTRRPIRACDVGAVEVP